MDGQKDSPLHGASLNEHPYNRNRGCRMYRKMVEG